MHLSFIGLFLVYICLDNIPEPQGKEAQMVSIVNGLDIESLGASLKLTKKQIQLLKSNLPVNRFWKIKEIDGIGITSYTKIFNYCYSYEETPRQMSLFEN